jgi:hypothetical protein
MQTSKAFVIVAFTGVAALLAQAQPASPEHQNKALELLRRTLGQEAQAAPAQVKLSPVQPAPVQPPIVQPPALTEQQQQAIELLRRETDEQRAPRPGVAAPRVHEPPRRKESAPAAPLIRGRGQVAPLPAVRPVPPPVPQISPAPEPEPEPAGPKTRQQRMAELIELYRADKITSAEYHARRAQILAEPAE